MHVNLLLSEVEILRNSQHKATWKSVALASGAKSVQAHLRAKWLRGALGTQGPFWQLRNFIGADMLLGTAAG